MGILTKFVASKVSGYALIALVVAAAGAGYWFWSELKEFGSLEAKAEQQQVTIEQQEADLETLRVQAKKRDDVNSKLAGQMNSMRQSFGAARQRIDNAEDNADKALRDCMDMHIASGMRFGTSAEPQASEDKAEPSVDEPSSGSS